MAGVKKDKSVPRKPGRPAARVANKDARESLLLAASRLYAARGAGAVSIREVAKAADMTPAMISYYFKNKQGLMRAVLERGLDHILDVLRDVANSHEKPASHEFIQQYIRTINSEPWLPQLMVREVFSGNPSYQSLISERFARKALELMPPRLAEDITAGRIRSDLDLGLTLMSLVGLCVFPYLAAPLLQPVLGYQLDEKFAEKLISHTTKLFYEGARG